MKLVLAGPIEGQLDKLYDTVDTMPEVPDWIVCAGDFGIWPDPERLDRGVKTHQGPGDFAKAYVNGYQARHSTLTISGVHEDHKWLKDRFESGNTEILSNIHWLANGYRTVVGDLDETIRITGLGKVYSESTYQGKFNAKSHRHYTRAEIEKACASGPTDLLVLYEHPNKPGIRNVIFATKPKLIIYVQQQSHPKKVWSVQDIPVFALHRGDLAAIEYKENQFIF